jgi:hypothetical protein
MVEVVRKSKQVENAILFTSIPFIRLERAEMLFVVVVVAEEGALAQNSLEGETEFE